MEISSDSSDCLNEIRDCLEHGKVKNALAIFNDKQFSENLKNRSWDLIPIITKYLSPQCEIEHPDLFEGCKQLMDKIADSSNPEEALLQLIEEIEESPYDTKFVALIFPTLRILLKISKNQLNSLAWYLNAIQTYLSNIEIVEENGEIEINSDQEILRLEMLYHDVLRLYEELILYFLSNLPTDEQFGSVITKHLIQLLGKPLGYLDLTFGEDKSRIRKITENIVQKVLTICRDPFLLLGTKSDSFVVPCDFSFGIFLYLILCEKIKSEIIPQVYNISYIFYSSLQYIVELLKSNRKLVMEKGLNTLETILQNNLKLSYSVLELEINKEFCQNLEKIIVFNEFEECRKQAFRIFQLYLGSFEVKGQYLLLYHLLPEIKHSGLAGFTITQYKDILVSLQKTQSIDLKYFNREKLYSFINKCCLISTYDESNLMNIADKIISVINLMRFVVLQEKFTNINEFRKVVHIWRVKYLDRLLILLADSKKKMLEDKHNIQQNANYLNEQELSLSVGGENISEMSKNEKIQSIEMSLTGYEMIESLLNRLIELLKLKNCYD